MIVQHYELNVQPQFYIFCTVAVIRAAFVYEADQ